MLKIMTEPRELRWVIESERLIECLRAHDWWSRRPKQFSKTVRQAAERDAASEGKTTVYQQHVLRAAADVAEAINNGIYERRGARRSRTEA